MKTDPTANISISIGIPQYTSQTLRGAASNKLMKQPASESISDTLETSDRDGDGRLQYQQSPRLDDTAEEGDIDFLG